MADQLLPIVRYLLLCQKVERLGETDDVVISRLITHVGAAGTFPFVAPEFWVVAHLTSCRGQLEFELKIRMSDTHETVFERGTFEFRFSNDPLNDYVLPFRIRQCVFPQAGLYSVELWCLGQELAQQTFHVLG